MVETAETADEDAEDVEERVRIRGLESVLRAEEGVRRGPAVRPSREEWVRLDEGPAEAIEVSILR